ncbi:unnamed protein product [Rhodiola kirilowii]
MVVVSQPALENSFIKICKPVLNIITGIPVIDMSSSSAHTHMIKACEDFGFFKVINHGVSTDLMASLEQYALQFFKHVSDRQESSRTT